ncbi:MAG: hypothetical protein NDI63_02150 [Pseudobdellovibrio sp.]|nr:hypothetical protein [Pseudobdellovibrio sp.]
MKLVFAILGAAILISSGIMIFLVKKGAALRPAGVIAPSEVGVTADLIGQAVGLRLFPDFQTAKNVVWYLDIGDEPFVNLPESTLANYQTNFKPELFDLRKNPQASCVENCWYVQTANVALPEALQQKIKTEPSLEIFVQYFDRDEAVPGFCENEKTLEVKCVRPVSVREVRKKLKMPAPYFFMRRYLDSQFYLFIEKAK